MNQVTTPHNQRRHAPSVNRRRGRMRRTDWNPITALIPRAADRVAPDEDIESSAGATRVLRRWSVAELIARAVTRAPEPRPA